MSVEATAVVLHHSRASGTDKLVLVGIANHEGDGGAWPTIATLAKYANVTPRAVQYALARLVASGEVEVLPNLGGFTEMRADRRPNRYRVLLACPASCDGTTNHRDGVKPTAPRAAERGEAQRVDGVKPTAPEPSSEPSLEMNHPSSVVSAEPSPTHRIFDAWKRSAGKNGRTVLTDARRKVIARALKDYQVEDLMDAVRGWEHSPHHRGENDQGTVYNDLELLLRDARHIERFRDLARGQGPRAPARMPRGAEPLRRMVNEREAANGRKPGGTTDPRHAGDVAALLRG